MKAYIYDTSPDRATAKLDTLLEPSDLHAEPRCRYADECGGYKWQHVRCGAQLDAKLQHVAEALEQHTEFENVGV